jgi:serine/threonine protein kinase/tetratricopeptide (TPR) repeat protein
MDAERWQRLSPLLDALIELDGDARQARLAALREEDPALATEVEALLALEEDNEDFLAEPLVAPPPMARPDTLIGPYKLDRLLGEGGMGQVWLARRADGLYQRRVALKLLRPGLADPNLRQRFTRERQILARLGHPHIARLLDAGISTDNQPYLALEYVEGEAITDWCRGRDLGIEARIKLFLQVCEAVSHAHANLIVHRDLKPSNILVTPLDEVRLLDFGIAKLLDGSEPGRDHTRTEVRAFTLHYAAPEQIRGEPVTTMTDVYSLGVVLYELLAETKPYRLKRQTDAEWEEAILVADPLKPSATLLREADSDPSRMPALKRRAKEIAGDLDNIVLKALSKRAEHRYASVEAMALDLHRYLEGKPVLARPQSVAYRTHKFVHRHRWVLATAALVMVVMASAMVLVSWQARQALREASRAQALQKFVTGLFEQAGGGAPGPLDVRKLLQAGEQRANRELLRQPLDRAELLGVIARLRIGLGDYREAEALLKTQDAILSGIDEVPDSLRLSSASDYGNTLRLLDRPEECASRMSPMENDARKLQRALPLQVAEFYSVLGRCHRHLRNAKAARLLFQRSLEVRRNSQDDAIGAIGVVENRIDLGDLERDAGNIPGALQAYRDALAQMQASADARHPLGIELQKRLCELERLAGQLVVAERHCHDALALALEVRGPAHPATVDSRRQLAAIHVDQGRYAEAEKAFRDSHGLLVARLGRQHQDVARNDNSLGIIAWERGDTTTALAHIDRALAVLRRQPEAPLYQNVLFNKAMILHEAGRDRAALPLLLQVDGLRVATLGKSHPRNGETARLLGEVRAALGEVAQARQDLVLAVRLTRSGHGLTHPHTRRAELSLAQFDLAHGDPPAPSVFNQLRLLADLPKSDPELRKIAWLAEATLALQACREPGFGDGRARLDAVAAEMSAAMREGGVIARTFERQRQRCR